MVALTKEKDELNGVQEEIQLKYKELCKHLGFTDLNKKKKEIIQTEEFNTLYLVSKEYGWTIERNENLLSSISPKDGYSIIGLVGRENIGKNLYIE